MPEGHGTSAGDDLTVSATTAISSYPEPANAKKPINQIQIFALLAGQVPSPRVAMLVQERGIDFEPDDEYLREARLAGGEDEQPLGFWEEECYLLAYRRHVRRQHVCVSPPKEA